MKFFFVIHRIEDRTVFVQDAIELYTAILGTKRPMLVDKSGYRRIMWMNPEMYCDAVFSFLAPMYLKSVTKS